MQTISLSATRRRKPLVILTGPAIGAQYSTPISVRLSRALLRSVAWVKCNCTPVRIVRALLSAKVSTVVAVVCIAAMWWHNLSIDSAAEAQNAVANDVLFAMPWGIVWAIRATLMPISQEGGEA